MPRIKAVVFDSDGTLFQISDFIPVFFDIMREVAKELTGRECTLAGPELYEFIQLPLKEARKLMKNKLGVDLREYWDMFAELDLETRKGLFGTKITLSEGAGILGKLSGKYRLGLLSATPRKITDLQLKHFGINNSFQAIVCGRYKCELSKPDTKGLELILDKLEVKPQEAVIVGDSDVDVWAGERVGTFTVKVIREHNHYYQDTDPDFTINSLKELEGVLCQLEKLQRRL